MFDLVIIVLFLQLYYELWEDGDSLNVFRKVVSIAGNFKPQKQ